MKKLNVTIKLEMSVPDDWELVQTSEGGQVLKMPDNQYLDLAHRTPVCHRPRRDLEQHRER
jgi:hypothetical protein